MFETRVSQSWGASDAILRDYLLEQLFADDGTGVAVFQARIKATGQRVWVKCQLNNAGEDLLAGEAALWAGINHANIPAPLTISRDGDTNYLVFPWFGEVPCESFSADSLDTITRLRISLGLARAVCYLQSLESPVAHTRISESTVWLTPTNNWPNLVGFENAINTPSDTELRQDRRDCWQAIQRIALSPEVESVDGRLDTAAESWLSHGMAEADRFTGELERAIVINITSGL